MIEVEVKPCHHGAIRGVLHHLHGEGITRRHRLSDRGDEEPVSRVHVGGRSSEDQLLTVVVLPALGNDVVPVGNDHDGVAIAGEGEWPDTFELEATPHPHTTRRRQSLDPLSGNLGAIDEDGSGAPSSISIANVLDGKVYGIGFAFNQPPCLHLADNEVGCRVTSAENLQAVVVLLALDDDVVLVGNDHDGVAIAGEGEGTNVNGAE
ncbi:MAG: hypothetical protein DDT34_02400 [Firmicutes bacterium]|nr:hypothetical protein [Bacillota bacterium]